MRLVAISLAAATLTTAAQGQTNIPQRSLNLQEAVGLAVAHNLNLQIERYNPQIALYDVNQAYAGYEPAFNFSGQRSYNENVDRLLAGGFRIPGSESENDSFRASLGGEGGGSALTPWGMTYNLSLNVSDTYGRSFNPITNGFRAVPFENSTGDISVDVRQPLLRNFLIDGTRYNIRVAKNRLKWSEYGLKYTLMQVITDTESAYYNLIASLEAVKVQEKAVELASRLLEENRKRVEVGALAPLEEKQAESEAASRRADLIRALADLAVAEDRLKSLITDRYSDWAVIRVIPSEPLTAPRLFFSRQDSWTRALQQRPDLEQARLNLERAGITLKYARNQLLPQLDVFGTFGYNGGGEEFSSTFATFDRADKPFWVYGGAVSIPLGNRSARSRVRASRAEQEQAVLALKGLEQQVMVNIDDAIKIAQSSYEAIEATRAAREFAEAALAAEEKKLESGKSTNFQVLELQKRLTDARNAEIAALASYNRALAQLRFLEGSTLEARGIDLNAQ